MTKDVKLFSIMMIAFLLMVMVLSTIFTVRYENMSFDEPTTISTDYVWQVNKHTRR